MVGEGLGSLANRFDLLETTETSIHEEITEALLPTTNNISKIRQPEENKSNNTNNTKSQVPPTSNPKVTTENKSNILMFADSHGREMYKNLAEIWPKSNVNISCIYKPNATLKSVVTDLKLLTKDFTKDDSVIIIGGTNDDIVDKEDKLINIFKDIIQLTTLTTVRIAAIPCRHDVPGLNNRIAYINMELEKILSQHLDADFLPVNILPRHMYTKKGIHFNRTGKKELSKMIKHSICGETKINTDNLRAQIHEEKLNLSMNSVTGIQVLEEDMGEIIENLKSNESCAFAHTISGDFHQDRRMTAGVAVVFAKQFGKPVWRDCLTKHLAYQRDGPRAAGVYSLITKDNFNDKPSRDDYNKAFHDLTHDFKSRTFSTLICSPLGCVRDHVKIEHFAKNINEFHQTTGAKVVVVTKEQSTARRVLHHGLSHAVFVRKLKEEIKKAGSADTPVTKDLGTSQSVPVSTQSSFNLNSFHLHCSDFPPLTVPTKSLQAPLTPGKNPSSCLNSLVPQQTPPC
ncbi:hypothetical protein J6590_052285 [Homalodisca vitripennis]|nr:hypothetical protein J6590_052285 [Homalodisca vitripennis]